MAVSKIHPNALIKTGTAQSLSQQEVYVNVGFRPRYISLCGNDASLSTFGSCVYDADWSSNMQIRCIGESDVVYANNMSVGPSTRAFTIKSIDDTGFTINAAGNSYYATTIYYSAIG